VQFAFPSMKRALLIAAMLGTALIAPTAQAETFTNTPEQGETGANGTGANNLNQMFNINANTPGVLNFSGTGTAQFNNTLSTSNNFNIGSSTNLGVNASVSSTPDYTGTASAYLGMDTGTKLQQTIGSSAAAANQQAVAEALASSASTSATEAANANYGSSFDEYSAKTGAFLAGHGVGHFDELNLEQQADFQTKFGGVFETASQWKAGWEEGYRETYNTAYSEASSNYQAQSSSTSEDVTGKISAAFTTTETGSASVGGSSGTFSSTEYATALATSTAQEAYSDAYNTAYSTASEQATFDALESVIATYLDETSSSDTFSGTTVAQAESFIAAQGITSDASYEAAIALAYESGSAAGAQAGVTAGSEAYQTAFAASYQGAFAEASSVAARTVTSNVDVVGLGSIANVNTNTDSLFSVDLASRMPTSGLAESALYGNNGTANGSAASSLSTSSYATQSVNTTANAFMQAFLGQ